MRSFSSPPSSRSLAVLAAWTSGVVLLTPLILLGGLIAVGALTASTLGRRIAVRAPARRQPARGPAPVLRLEVSPAESNLGVMAHRAA